MNPGGKQSLKAQLMAISQIIGAPSSVILSGAAQPIATPMGPAAAPGLIQMGTALNQQTAQIQKLIDQIQKIADDL